MRTVTTKVYTFGELSEEAQKRALEELSGINVDHEWWDFTYEDAKNIGLAITGFDLGRSSYVEGHFVLAAEEVARAIIKNHGDKCETVKTAKDFLEAMKALPKDEDGERNRSDVNSHEEEFLRSLCEDYRIMLQHEYDHAASEEAIKETILANEYEFTVKGKMY